MGVDKAPTHFGPVSYQLQYDAARAVVTGEVTFPRRQSPETVTLYLRLPKGLQAVSAATPTGAELLADEGTLRWTRPGGTARFEVAVQ